MKKYFKDFGIAVRDGDLWTKLSLIIMGAGYWKRGQIAIIFLMTAQGIPSVFYGDE
ncbi:MAG: hypothetical protein MRZ49_09175 [Lachnospiraceae bacterium]|nr:hypothetical protein [Lachnospiraceae bacterium]